MILQALVQHLLAYRSCRVGSVVPIVCSAEHTPPSAEPSCPEELLNQAVMLPVRVLSTTPAA